MRSALERGCAALPDEERAPRRETESPKKSSSLQPGYSVGQPSRKAPRSRLLPQPGDTSRPIENAGHAKLCIKKIGEMIKADHGSAGYWGPLARDYFVAIAKLEDTAAAADPHYERGLAGFIVRHLPGYSETEQADALAEIRAHPFAMTARLLGEVTCLTAARRAQFKFWLADPIDMSVAEAARIGDKERKDRKRREQGVPRRGERIAEAKRLAPTTPVKTLYDQVRYNRKPRKLPNPAARHSETTSGRGGPIPPSEVRNGVRSS